MKLIWHESAWNDYLEWQATDKKKLKRINQLIRDISRNGYNATGKPESLSGNLSGFYSVRIDKKNRIVFRIIDNTVEIAQCKTHYKEH